jgi:gamma-glutamyltranspeptidase
VSSSERALELRAPVGTGMVATSQPLAAHAGVDAPAISLRARGHEVTPLATPDAGGAQAILRDGQPNPARSSACLTR